MENVVIVTGDDWAGVYVNGQLRYEDHRITGQDMCEILDIPHTRVDVDEYLEDHDSLPERIEDLIL